LPFPKCLTNERVQIWTPHGARSASRGMSDPDPPLNAATSTSEVLKFEPWQSAVDPTFWAELARRKLDTFGLSEDAVPVNAQFACAAHADVSSPAQLDERSFEDWRATSLDASASGRLRMPGTLWNVNTFERFKAFDRKAACDRVGEDAWNAILDGSASDDPSVLNRFTVVTFADLKSWTFAYWFCFPALKLPEPVRVERRDGRTRSIDPRLAEAFDAYLGSGKNEDAFAWCVVTRGDAHTCHPLRALIDLIEAHGVMDTSNANSSASGEGSNQDVETVETVETVAGVAVAFADPCARSEHPGWCLRNLAALLAVRLSARSPETDRRTRRKLRVFAARTRNGKVSGAHSRVFDLVLPDLSEYPDARCGSQDVRVSKFENSNADRSGHRVRCPFPRVGWELNANGRVGPRRADLGETMDPAKVAASAAALNLKLMRWRLLPDLDLERVASTKALLLGAGTLGCCVARCLLGWGVRTFTFVDDGLVSFSNPVRQSLFEFADSLNGGAPKAEAAARNLRKILPGVDAKGVRLRIPMPGHPVTGDAERSRVLRDVDVLRDLVAEHDVVFLLTDTRESRWLPTLMCAATDTLLINAALGFDSYLVMRHGGGVESAKGSSEDDQDARDDPDAASEPEPRKTEKKTLPENGSRLGCYFCNDVMAPGNSTVDRTLDQQCTVTRPGLAPIAGALAAELCVAMRHLRGGGTRAPSDVGDASTSGEPNHPTPLGIVPHIIRGNVSTYSQTLFSAPAFGKCTACSELVVARFSGGGGGGGGGGNTETETETEKRDFFLFSAFADPTFLEDETGLTAMHSATDAAEWLGSDGEDDF